MKLWPLCLFLLALPEAYAQGCDELLAGQKAPFLPKLENAIHQVHKLTVPQMSAASKAELGEKIQALQTMFKYPGRLMSAGEVSIFTNYKNAFASILPYGALLMRFMDVQKDYARLQMQFHQVSLSNPEQTTFQKLAKDCKNLWQQEYATGKSIEDLRIDLEQQIASTDLTIQREMLGKILPQELADTFQQNFIDLLQSVETDLRQWSSRIIIMKDSTKNNLANVDNYLRAFPHES
jgi:hypothetical protein